MDGAVIEKTMQLTQMSLVLMALLATSVACPQTHAQSTGTAAVSDITVDLPSGKRFYRDSGGQGVPVVFLHAGSGNSMLWEHQIPAFTGAGYRFIAIDFKRARGSVESPPPNAPPVPYINELLAKLGIQKFHLVGTAAGGGLALQYALANRERLRSITVANSIGNVQDKEYSEMGRRIRPVQFDQLPLELRELGPSYRAANPEGVSRWLVLSGGNETAEHRPTTPGSAPPANGPGGPNHPNAVTWAKLETFKVPTLLLTGDADLYTPPSVLRMFSARMPHAESAIVPESGHSAYWENPAVFNRTVLNFIGKH